MAWPRRARSCLPAYVPPYPIAVACGRPATQLPAWRRLISSSPSSSPLRDKGQRFVLRRGGSSHAAAGQHRAAAARARCSTTLCAAAGHGHRCAAGQRLACGRRAVSRVGGEMRARLCAGAAAASGVEGAAGAIWPPALCSGWVSRAVRQPLPAADLRAAATSNASSPLPERKGIGLQATVRCSASKPADLKAKGMGSD
ncbi:hypothetical protein PVAP13_6NG137303 [Panicum virgatum]|uniref:Uncharacterized protein n=1 Tax=Panicum virgatum TaxID=38727 RepID=A0A8T0R072_PANVG|nr:hypothetical protein PVAP13_6NG137303 [Panicum virgatum]